MSTPPSDENLLDRVRKLLAKAEAEGVTPHEAEALTGKAAGLMARYGIGRGPPGDRHAGRQDCHAGQPVGHRQGPPAVWARPGHALPVRPAQWQKPTPA